MLEPRWTSRSEAAWTRAATFCARHRGLRSDLSRGCVRAELQRPGRPRAARGARLGGVARLQRRARSTPRQRNACPGAKQLQYVAAKQACGASALAQAPPRRVTPPADPPAARQSFDVGSLKASLAMVPPSPMFQTVAGVNPVMLRADSAEGQALRRKALRGAVVVFFTAGAVARGPAPAPRLRAIGVRSGARAAALS